MAKPTARMVKVVAQVRARRPLLSLTVQLASSLLLRTALERTHLHLLASLTMAEQAEISFAGLWWPRTCFQKAMYLLGTRRAALPQKAVLLRPLPHRTAPWQDPVCLA